MTLTNDTEPNQLTTNDNTDIDFSNGYSSNPTKPIKMQDYIKSDLLELARSRNLHIPGILDPANEAKISRLPRSIQALYMAPMRKKPTHGYPVANLQLRGYSVRNVELMADFAVRAAFYLNMPAKGPVPLPRITERWTVPRSNFVHKKSQENWERVTYRRLVQAQDGHPDVVRRWLGFVRKWMWYGVGMKADVFEWEGMDVSKRMEEKAANVGDLDKQVRWDLFGRRKSMTSREEVEKTLDSQGFGSKEDPKAPPPRKPEPPHPSPLWTGRRLDKNVAT